VGQSLALEGGALRCWIDLWGDNCSEGRFPTPLGKGGGTEGDAIEVGAGTQFGDSFQENGRKKGCYGLMATGRETQRWKSEGRG